MKSKNTAIDHIAKQKKKKSLSDEMVYSSVNGVVEMHRLGVLKLSKFGNEELEKIIKGLLGDIDNLNDRLDKTKGVLAALDARTKKIEKELKDYGLVK